MTRSPSSSSAPDGVVLIDKPAGLSSRRAAADAAARLGAAKFGHAGTLDPFATGLLVVLLGRACRTQDWFTTLPKAYDATERFGAVSTTGDPEGEISETGSEIPEPLVLPTGTVRQRPPAYSAVHVDGRRAYQRARAGEEFELPEREVEVYEFRETGRSGNDVGLHIRCSSGTYVRSLVSDLGDAYTARLCRTAVGPFKLDEADPQRVIPIGSALTFLPTLQLSREEATRAGHGQAVEAGGRVEPPSWSGAPGGAGAILLLEGSDAVAIAARGEGEALKPVVGFRG